MRKLITTLLVLFITAVLLVACGGQQAAVPAEEPAAEEPAAEEPAAEGGVTELNILWAQ